VGHDIQLRSDGIRLGAGEVAGTENRHITIKNVNAHHFGRDGMTLVRGGVGMDLVIEDCHFDYNGRIGFAWSNGTGLRMSNSTFNYNATGRIRSTMASGVNIELELEDGPGAPVPSDGHFID
jgi:type 1 fimbria pilin